MRSRESHSIHLVLFFSRNVSLRTWAEVGMFDREVALYLRHQKEGLKVSFLTYGDESELEYSKRIPGIDILYNKWRLPLPLYFLLIPLLHSGALRRASVLKTNQLSGGRIALWSSKLWRKPLIVRCGNIPSDMTAQSNIKNPVYMRRLRRYEAKIFHAATAIIVASPAMRDYVTRTYSVLESLIHVVSNHVLTDLFRPKVASSLPNRLCFVGRLEKQKNVETLVEACSGTRLNLVLIGNGSLRKDIKAVAMNSGVNVTFMGNLPHAELPYQLCKSHIYVHATHYEGSPPKALLEAMSCGLPVICSNVPGISEFIIHGVTGWLCGTSREEIRNAIDIVLGDGALQERLGRNARESIVKSFTLDEAARNEVAILKTVAL